MRCDTDTLRAASGRSAGRVQRQAERVQRQNVEARPTDKVGTPDRLHSVRTGQVDVGWSLSGRNLANSEVAGCLRRTPDTRPTGTRVEATTTKHHGVINYGSGTEQ